MGKCKSCDDSGWIHHQHPLKPPGVIMNSTPCSECNPSLTKPFPFTAPDIQCYPCPNCEAKATEIAELKAYIKKLEAERQPMGIPKQRGSSNTPRPKDKHEQSP